MGSNQMASEGENEAKTNNDEQQEDCCAKNCGPDTMAFKIRVQIQQVIMGIFTLAALIFILVCIFAEKSALPGNGLLLVFVFFLGVYLLALNEGLQIAILQGNKLKLSPATRFLPSFHEAAKCLELVEGIRLQWWLGGRQFFVICSVFVVAQVTTFNDMKYWPWAEQFWDTPVTTTLAPNATTVAAGTGDGEIPNWFRVAVLQTGVLGALVVVIIGQLVPQLVAVPCPILFFSLPGSHLILQIGLFFHYIGITYIAFLLTMMVRCCLKPKIPVVVSPDGIGCKIMDPIRYIFSTCVFAGSVFLMIYGIGYEYARLPGAWWLHMIILVVMMITLAYLEGLQVALIDAKKCVEKLTPCALSTFNLTKEDESMGRFLCGRQVLVIFSVYLASQVTAFADMKTWPYTDTEVPDWFYVGVCKTGLPAVIVICAVSQLLPQLVAVSHPDIVLRAPAAYAWVGLALGVEFIGLARCAALLGWAIEKCLPPSYMIPWNQDFEQCLHAVFQDLQNSDPKREFEKGTKVSYDPETGEGTIDFPAAESSKAGAEAGSEEEAGSKVKSINFQTA